MILRTINSWVGVHKRSDLIHIPLLLSEKGYVTSPIGEVGHNVAG
jgi:hypothetical protein